MNQFKGFLFVVVFICFGNSCKQDELDFNMAEDTYRIRKITETDNIGEEIRWDIFSYDVEKLVMWEHFYKSETGEVIQDWKIEAEYKGTNIVTTKSGQRNNVWHKQQECNLSINDNHVVERTISRLNFPICNDCWRYDYEYEHGKLIGWEKFLKTENGEWVQTRKIVYVYKSNKLLEYLDFVNFDETELKLDYKKTYVYTNDRLTGWMGGICIEDGNWKPTRKVEYEYEQSNISNKIWLGMKDDNSAWEILGSVNYYFDENNRLIEESTSLGARKTYEYEPGKGNTALIYCIPDENETTDPILKNSF